MYRSDSSVLKDLTTTDKEMSGTTEDDERTCRNAKRRTERASVRLRTRLSSSFSSPLSCPRCPKWRYALEASLFFRPSRQQRHPPSSNTSRVEIKKSMDLSCRNIRSSKSNKRDMTTWESECLFSSGPSPGLQATQQQRTSVELNSTTPAFCYGITACKSAFEISLKRGEEIDQ